MQEVQPHQQSLFARIVFQISKEFQWNNDATDYVSKVVAFLISKTLMFHSFQMNHIKHPVIN